MAPFDVEATLSRLSEREKLSLLAGIDFWHTRALPKHGVPSIRMSDGPNGIRGTRFFNSIPAACLPCGTALGATFDQDLMYEAGRLMGAEAKAKGAHVILGPTINMQRSPLGGRGFESYGEDPVASGKTAAAFINGIQSRKILAALKHFVCNDQEHERNKVNSIVTQRALREIYLLPFQIAIRDSHPKAIMTSYNKVNGVHAAEDKSLLQDILRDEWKWEGLVVSDWFGTYSTSESINAGLDLEMPGPSRWRGEAAFIAATTDKLYPTAVDQRARAVLQMVNACQESEIPENAPESSLDDPETSALLRRLAAESIVLLKNDRNVLPLKKDVKTLVIGPNADVTMYCGGGSAALRPTYTVTPLQGIRGKVSEETVYTVGAYAHRELPDLALMLWPTPDGAEHGVTFKVYNEAPQEANRVKLDELKFETANMMFMDFKNPKLNELWYADVEGYLKPDQDGEFEFGVCVYGSAQLFVDDELVLDITEHQRQGSAFLGCGTEEERAKMQLCKGRTYKVRLSFASAPTSKLNPQGVQFGNGAVKLGGVWTIEPEQEIAKAAELAQNFDQVILCIGLNQEWECEGFDRQDMKLPPNIDHLAQAVVEANPNTVIVMQSGTPVEMPWLSKASTLLHAWYGGNETGNGLADVLFGDVNPSAKLPLTFPVRNQDTPTYFNFRSEAGRVLYGEDVYMGYRWYDSLQREVNFPFGFGLSYTSFKIEDLAVHKDGDSVVARVQVKNTGSREGAQTLQAYISHASPSIRRPVKELKAFKKVRIESGHSCEVTFDIPIKQACSFFDERRNQWVCEAGSYEVIISDNSKLEVGAYLSASFQQDKTFWWTGL